MGLGKQYCVNREDYIAADRKEPLQWSNSPLMIYVIGHGTFVSILAFFFGKISLMCVTYEKFFNRQIELCIMQIKLLHAGFRDSLNISPVSLLLTN